MPPAMEKKTILRRLRPIRPKFPRLTLIKHGRTLKIPKNFRHTSTYSNCGMT
jgi:hypothetical protein